jgi:hypothetical protein
MPNVRFDGKIVYDDGTEIGGITGEYVTYAPFMGTKSWRGHCVVPAGKMVTPGDCRLVLNDGREARIVIDSFSVGSSQTTIAFFKGSGPWP